MSNKVYEIIQKQVIKNITKQLKEMEKDPNVKFSWVKPWGDKSFGVDMPFNDNKGNYYRGINLLLLDKGGAYLTEKNIADRGYVLKQGAKWNMVVFWKFPKKEDEDKDIEDIETEGKHRVPILRYYKVYHESYIEGFERKHHIEQDTVQDWTLDGKEKRLEDILTEYCLGQGIHLNIANSRNAYYSESLDKINIPELSQYSNKIEYLSTFSHEVVHSTGCESRLNRKGFSDHSKEEYSKEELVAEIGAAMLLAMNGIEDVQSKNNSVAYLKGWLTCLKEDISLITYAAQRAQKAVDFIQEYAGVVDEKRIKNMTIENQSTLTVEKLNSEIQGFGLVTPSTENLTQPIGDVQTSETLSNALEDHFNREILTSEIKYRMKY